MTGHHTVERGIFATTAFILCVAGITIVPSRAQVVPPTTWDLLQNEPNPFCPEDGPSAFDMITPRAAHLELLVWLPDSTAILRTLVTTDVPAAGVLRVWWDGRDVHGTIVPEGRYPYTFRATDEAAALLFEDSKSALVQCATGVESSRWERIKKLYR